MKTIQVKEQVRLSLSKCFELVLSGIRFRLFRAAITVVVVSLAVAFLMTMLTESLIARRVATAIEAQTAPRKQFLFWASRLSVPLTDTAVTSELAAADAGRLAELKTWGSLTDPEMEKLVSVCRRQKQDYEPFFDALPEGSRRMLVGRAQGSGIFAALADDKNFASFADGLKNSDSQLPHGLEDFKQFIADWQAYAPLKAKIVQGHAKAIEQLKTLWGDTPAPDKLAHPSPELAAQLAGLGFRMPPADIPAIQGQAALSTDAERLVKTLGISRIRTRLAQRANITNPADVNAGTLYGEINSSSGAAWFGQQMTEMKQQLPDAEKNRKTLAEDIAKLDKQDETLQRQIANLPAEIEKHKAANAADLQKAAEKALGDAQKSLPQVQEELKRLRQDQVSAEALLAFADFIRSFNLTPQRMMEVAKDYLDANNLSEVEATVAQAAAGTGFFGFSARTQWLILVSFMVCMVGIANAMLMSVTERFREIATMKCLGATDGFIMVNFILESCMQGLAGGVVGMIFGLLLGGLRSWATYGWLAISSFPGVDVLIVAGVSFVAGIVLSALAAVYPAWVAARLAPMEAMRIE